MILQLAAACCALVSLLSSKKIFEFEKLANSNKKEGWFNRIDVNNRKSYGILFENGIAKSLSYIAPDSTVYIFSIDSNFLNGRHMVYYPQGNIKEHGNYKNNARIGQWRFYNVNGTIKEEGNYMGEYNELLYDANRGRLITVNRFLDTIRMEKFTQKQYDSLRIVLGQKWGTAFPVQLHFKDGPWKYYDDSGRLAKEETYEKGTLIKAEKK